jgi:tRNA A37 threonylcarbamoyladenosine synthetase subunit TsaC/SUA5/YrdC
MQQEQFHQAMAQDQKVKKQRSQKHPLSCNAEKFRLAKRKLEIKQYLFKGCFSFFDGRVDIIILSKNQVQ